MNNGKGKRMGFCDNIGILSVDDPYGRYMGMQMTARSFFARREYRYFLPWAKGAPDACRACGFFAGGQK